MTSTFVRRVLRTTLMGGVVAGSLLSHTVAASANTPVTVATGGSDTTQDFMAAYMASTTGSTVTSNGVSYDVTNFNIPAVPGASGYSVPDDGNCTATTPANPQFPGGTMSWQAGSGTPTAPNGSGAGRARLALEEDQQPGLPRLRPVLLQGRRVGLRVLRLRPRRRVPGPRPSLKAPGPDP